MKSLRKLLFSAIVFTALLGSKPVIAEELISEENQVPEIEAASDDIESNDLDADISIDQENTTLVSDMSGDGEAMTEKSADESVSGENIDITSDENVSASDQDLNQSDGDSETSSEADNDLIELADTADETTAVQHLTVLDNVDYALVYDYTYYTNTYADIKAAFGDDELATLQHFVTCGMSEQRQGIESFDEVSYRRAYADLRRAFGFNYVEFYKHYMNCGYSEGRILTTGISKLLNPVTVYDGVDYSSVYDYEYYINKYEDVKSAFWEADLATLKNFITRGMSEQRQGCSNFDVTSYRRAYADLRSAFGSNYVAYYKHYINYGSKEGRSLTVGIGKLLNPITEYGGVNYSLVYNYTYYIDKYADIKAAFGEDDLATLKHFVTCGMSEQRQGCADFDEVSYRRAYADLRCAFGLKYAEYYKHYISCGNKEGRSLTDGITQLLNPVTVYLGVDYKLVYDYDYYLSHYADLKAAFGENDLGALEHFVVWGMSEKRQGCENFDVVSYRNAYVDLRRAFGNNYPAYYLHYINNGSSEGRTLTTGITVVLGNDRVGTIIEIPDGLGYYYTYMGWQCVTNTSSTQYKLRVASGENYDSYGFARINGRFVIACTSTFGKIGDYVDFELANGLTLECVIGDEKSQVVCDWDSNPANQWGHDEGACVIEFVVDKTSWYTDPMHVNVGTTTCFPELKSYTVRCINYGSWFDDSSLGVNGSKYGLTGIC